MKKQGLWAFANFLSLVTAWGGIPLYAADYEDSADLCRLYVPKTSEEKLSYFFSSFVSGTNDFYLPEFDNRSFIDDLYTQFYGGPSSPPEMTIELAFLTLLYYWSGGQDDRNCTMPESTLKSIEDFLMNGDIYPYMMSKTCLGIMYREGIGYEVDPLKALDLLTQSANTGFSFAQRELARLYEGDESDDSHGLRNMDKTIELYERAMAQGDKWAQRGLAHMFFFNGEKTKNTARAINLLIPLAESGDLEAIWVLSVIYFSPEYKELDEAITYSHIREKILNLLLPLPPKNTRYYSDFLVRLGHIYKNDHGIVGGNDEPSFSPKNLEETVVLLEALAADGNKEVIDSLVEIYRFGGEPFKAPEKAVKLLEDFIQKSPDRNFMFKEILATLYANGEGCPQDKSKAIALLEDTLSQGNRQSVSALHKLLDAGERTRLIILLTEAIPQHPSLTMALANLYIRGSQTVKDEQKAAELLEPLAKTGDVEASYTLYHLYLYGSDAVKDHQKAHDFITALSHDFPCYTADYFLNKTIVVSSCVEDDRVEYRLSPFYPPENEKFSWDYLRGERGYLVS